MLDTHQLSKFSIDPTKKTEEKIQRVARKTKISLSTQEYSTLYPTGSCPGRFYGTTKLNGKVDQLPIRPIAFNAGTTTYQLANLLSKPLSTLSHSQYTVMSPKDFIEKIHNVNVPHGFNMILFDVKYSFTSVLLEEPINVALVKI